MLKKGFTLNTKIIVCYHKPFHLFANEVLLPLHVGKANSSINIDNMIGDNTGDNISFKNGNYCELTGLYWAWKNLEADNYGLFHYRRFLDVMGKYKGQIYPSKIKLSDWSKENLDSLMCEYDVILPTKSKFKISVYERYKKDHIGKDLDAVIDIIKKDYPQYTSAVDKSLHINEEYCCNTFIMKKAIFNEYCEWLFDILGKVEKQTNINKYDAYQSRIYGFLSERMINIFIQFKIESDPNFRIKHVNSLMINLEPKFCIKLGFAEFINYPNKYFIRIFGVKFTKNKRKK